MLYSYDWNAVRGNVVQCVARCQSTCDLPAVQIQPGMPRRTEASPPTTLLCQRNAPLPFFCCNHFRFRSSNSIFVKGGPTTSRSTFRFFGCCSLDRESTQQSHTRSIIPVRERRARKIPFGLTQRGHRCMLISHLYISTSTFTLPSKIYAILQTKSKQRIG